MSLDSLAKTLFDEIVKIPILDPHSHIDPFAPTAQSLDDLLGYHYFTELAHSAGMSKICLRSNADPRDRCREIIKFATRFDNTIQYSWLLEIAKTFLGFTGHALTPDVSDEVYDAAKAKMNQVDWESQVVSKTNLESIFLTNSFDDRLDGFNTQRYVPCLRTDDVVFHLHDSAIMQRLQSTTQLSIDSIPALRNAIDRIFERFKKAGARACAISLPPSFEPTKSAGELADDGVNLNHRFNDLRTKGTADAMVSAKVFWMLAEACRKHGLPFDLMIGVNRRVYPGGVFQGQDLFDQRTSLIQYADLFNAFPEVLFCISVLTSVQNQELTSYAWIFANVRPMGHWWYSNIPCYIENDLRARLSAVPKSKLIGYYSDAYKLEFVLPKFNMYRRSLARVLADDFVRAGRMSEAQAIEFARTILRDNVISTFSLETVG